MQFDMEFYFSNDAIQSPIELGPKKYRIALFRTSIFRDVNGC